MIKAVLDTNVLVSALWTPLGNASAIVNLILSDRVIPCFDQGIINEYRIVLSRPRLAFSPGQVDSLRGFHTQELATRGSFRAKINGMKPETNTLLEQQPQELAARGSLQGGVVDRLLSEISNRGLSIIAPSSTFTMADESDRKFYDTAKFCNAYLVTGNIKHYPGDKLIVSPARFIATHAK
jgi:predicted nucleic acid-binding protein